MAHRKKYKPQTHKKPSESPQHQNLIEINNQTIIVYNAGEKEVNGVYEQKQRGGNQFTKVDSIQSHKDEYSKSAQFEIDRHEYFKNPNDIPHPSLHKSGVWIISRVDVFPKQQLYAVNCPFADRIKTNGWIVLKHGVQPAPKVKQHFIAQSETDHRLKQNKEKVKIQRQHGSNKLPLNDMQLKSIVSKVVKSKQHGLTVVSGGQTGVDRAALDAAIALNIAYGGWLPKGRKAEDGTLDEVKYANLQETDSEEYEVRTLLNVVDSNATLILNAGKLGGGTLTTRDYISQKNKDMMYITLTLPSEPTLEDKRYQQEMASCGDEDSEEKDIAVDYAPTLSLLDGRAQRVSEWIRCTNIRVLNVAGPRESKRPGIYAASMKFLTEVLGDFQHVKVQENTQVQ